MPEDDHGWNIGDIALDVIDVTACAAGVLSSLVEDATGVGAVLGGVQGAASGVSLVTGFGRLVADAKGSDSGDGSYKPVPPRKGDELLNDAYENGKVPEQDLDEGGQGYAPDSPSRPGEPPKYDKNGNLIPYKEFTDVGPRKNGDELLVVDEKNGHMYYSDDNGTSYVRVA